AQRCREATRRDTPVSLNVAAGWAVLLTSGPADRFILAVMTFRGAALLTLVTCLLAVTAAVLGRRAEAPSDPRIVATALDPLDDPRLAPYRALREARTAVARPRLGGRASGWGPTAASLGGLGLARAAPPRPGGRGGALGRRSSCASTTPCGGQR